MGMLGQRRPVGGFTVIELMVTVAVAGVMLALAVPSFQAVINGNRLTGAANELLASLQGARMEAIRQNKRAVVCLSSNANAGAAATCGTAGVDGWISFIDTDKNGAFNAGDVLLRNATFGGGLKVTGISTVVFRSDGLARSAAGALTDGDVSLCLPTRLPAENVRKVNISAGGRVAITKENKNGACS